MAQFTYPTSEELHEIEREKLIKRVQSNALSRFAGVREIDDHLVSWEQKGNVVGLQQARGLDGAPARVKRVGGNRFNMEPGVYGEYISLEESELTKRRQWGTFGTPINITDLVMEASDQLQQRFIDRWEYIVWSAVSGTISVPGPNGVVLHQDTFPVQRATATVPWATAPSAAPLQDLRSLFELARGKSTSLTFGADYWMTQKTFNNMIKNTNGADLYGKRMSGLSTPLSINDINIILAGENLGNIVIYEEGYFTDALVWTPFIPDNYVYVIGKRDSGAKVVTYQFTRNVNNSNMAPGQYTKVIDKGEDQVPRVIEVHNGHNGGPAVEFPGSICILNVG